MLLGQLLSEVTQLFQAAVVTGEATGPDHAEYTEHHQCGGVHGALAPIDTAHFFLIQPGKVGLGEDHAVEQVIDKARTASAEGRQRAAGQA